MDIKEALSGSSKQRNGSYFAAARRLWGRRRENNRGRNNARGGPKAWALGKLIKDSHIVQRTASSDQSIIRPDPDPVLEYRQHHASQTDTGPRDVDSQSDASNIALLDGVPVGPDYTENAALSDGAPVNPDNTSPPSGYSKQDIQTWRHSTKPPDGPDWERLSVGRLRLPARISSTDMITETAVAIHAARDSLTLASRSPATASTVRETSARLIRTLALSLGVASGSVAMRNLPDLAQRIMDPAGGIDAAWEHLSPDLAEAALAKLEGELGEAVGREVERLGAESFEMRRDYEWGHFPRMGLVANELRFGECVEPRLGADVSHTPERDLAKEADIWFAIWQERRERGEALGMWHLEEEQEWSADGEV